MLQGAQLTLGPKYRMRAIRPSAARQLWTAAERASFQRDGFILKHNIISAADARALALHYEDLFAGRFPTGIYPDEWHWREGISLPTAVREIVNGWKSSPAVARIALSPALGYAAADLLGWPSGSRLGQDDVLWKPAGSGGVGYHVDSAYISDQFQERDDSSVTIWIALDDADESNGAVEYAVGSHRWRLMNATNSGESATTSSFHGSEGDVAQPAYDAASRIGIKPPDVELRTMSVPIGSALFHSQDVWHGSRNNGHSTRHRRALAIHLLRRNVSFRTDRAPDYIYGRYVMGKGREEVGEAFFPITWAPAAATVEESVSDGEYERSEAARELERRGLIAPLYGEEEKEEETLVPHFERSDVEEEEGADPAKGLLERLLARWSEREACE